MSAPPSAAIALQDLRFAWRGSNAPTLTIDRLEIERGARVFLAGPSGSGKTTLLHLIAGVVVPTSGTIEVLGTSLGTLSGPRRDAFRTRHIGIVFQTFNLIPYLSLIDNVLLPCRFSKARLQAAMSDSGRGRRSARDEARHLLETLGLDVAALSRRAVVRLSTGQQQRVAVARALIGAPEIVLCDEPTSALDPASQRGFLDLLFREADARGTTLVFASHDLALARYFERVVELPIRTEAGTRSVLRATTDAAC
ncbi:MAG: ABC transporter ATP-binding protein [Defluviicoccus sp.]|nr:MAG: ABC transporter ATP-binding protein [Defluviicoccus sp.]